MVMLYPGIDIDPTRVKIRIVSAAPHTPMHGPSVVDDCGRRVGQLVAVVDAALVEELRKAGVIGDAG